MRIYIYTDGACKGNPGKGGYGIVMECKEKKLYKEFFQGYKKTTNNRMELLAVIISLEKIKIGVKEIEIFTDSKYVMDSVEKKWVFSWEKKNFKGKKNIDLWKRFLIVYRKHNVKFNWVKGHSGHIQNERCDELANEGCNSDNLIEDKEFISLK